MPVKHDPGCPECRGIGYIAVGDEAEACVMGRDPSLEPLRVYLDNIEDQSVHETLVKKLRGAFKATRC